MAQPRKKPSRNLPFKAPDVKCNARLARGGGYCDNPAGFETNHVGIGRCRMHGGKTRTDGPDGPLDLFRANGLGPLIDMAEVMTKDDQEYLMYVSTNALVITRAGIAARMREPSLSSREVADLSMALTRVDSLLAKHLNDEDPDAAPNSGPSAEDVELERLMALESKDAAP